MTSQVDCPPDYRECLPQNWYYDKKFAKSETGLKYLNDERIWKIDHKKCIEVKNGYMVVYSCRAIANNFCPAARCLFFPCDNSDVLLFKFVLDHRHKIPLGNNTSDMVEEGLQYSSVVVEINQNQKNQQEEDTVDENIIASDTALFFSFENDDNTCVRDFINEEEKNGASHSSKWRFERTFDNIDMAETHLTKLLIWKKFTNSISRVGLKEFYHCNLANQKSSIKCCAKLYLLHCSKTNKIALYRNNIKHMHKNMLQPIQGDELKKYKKILCDVGTNAWMYETRFIDPCTAQVYIKNLKMILIDKQTDGTVFYEFYRCGLEKLCPVTYYIKRTNVMLDVILYKNITIGHAHNTQTKKSTDCHIKKISVTSIANWLKCKSKIPPENDFDSPFYLNYIIDHTTNNFHCFITTRRLLKIALDYGNIVHADFKCDLNWLAYPLIIIGTSDMDQQFHSFGICICPMRTEQDYIFVFNSLKLGIAKCFGFDYKPSVLVCNSKTTIQNAFAKVFGNSGIKYVVCSDFMILDLSTKLKSIGTSDTIQNQILFDIKRIQKLRCRETFYEAIILFFNKWANQTEFLEYLMRTWIYKNANWYVGFLHYTPSTNEALVSEYRRINFEYNLKFYTTFSSFKILLNHLVETWSVAYAKAAKVFVKKPTISETLYMEACIWKSHQSPIDIEKVDDETIYYYVTNGNTVGSPDKFAKYKLKFDYDWANFFDVQSRFWEIKEIENADDIKCSCPVFFKNYICKHSLSMTIARYNLFEAPSAPSEMGNNELHSVTTDTVDDEMEILS